MDSAIKKIGIITILKVNNYGAELQAFALQKVLNNLGYDSENIDYLYYKHPDYIAEKRARPIVPIKFKSRVKRVIQILIEKISLIRYAKSLKIKRERFSKFTELNTRMSEKTYRSMSELYDETFNYDVYMVGSDQVWNPRTQTSLKPFFLTFAPTDKPKISYASSFGISVMNKNVKTVFAEYLNNFNHLSIREEQGIKIIKELTGRNAIQVLDPTLLISKKEWLKIAVLPNTDRPYILLYILSFSSYATNLANYLKKITGYDVVRICTNPLLVKKHGDTKNIIDAGPSEFLGWFNNAALVLTNSFHGTTFSVIFRKPFFVVTKAGKSNNSRQESFLKLMQLSSRLIEEGDAFPSKKELELDYSHVKDILTQKRKISIDFLINSISDRG